MPQAEFDIFGKKRTGTLRIRPGLLFGVVLEELVIYIDQTQYWEKSNRAYILNPPKDKEC